MRADQMENERYKQDDHCYIELEEELMFKLLEKYRKYRKTEPQNISVLDVGCGSGRITKKIQELGYQIRGLDFSDEAVKKANDRGIEAVQCNLDEGMKANNEEFDVVWAGDIIEHVFDPMGLLREANRVLKNGGVLIGSIPSDVGLNNRLRMLFGISYQEHMYRRSGFYKHHTFFTLRLLDFMLQAAKLRRITSYKILILPFKKRLLVNFFPSALYNEVIFMALKR